MSDDVLTVMQEHPDPFVTLTEVHDRVDVSKGTVHERMQELVADGEIKRKTVGSSAVVWWLPEREPQLADD